MLKTAARAVANLVMWFGVAAFSAGAVLVDGLPLRILTTTGAMVWVAVAAAWSVHQYFAGLADEATMRASMRDVVLGATEEATRQQVAALPRAIRLAKQRTRRHRRQRGRIVIGVDPATDAPSVVVAHLDHAGRPTLWPDPAGASTW